MSEQKLPPELGAEIPGLKRMAGHVTTRMRIAVDDVVHGPGDEDRRVEQFVEEMRQDIMYYGWLYLKAAEQREE